MPFLGFSVLYSFFIQSLTRSSKLNAVFQGSHKFRVTEFDNVQTIGFFHIFYPFVCLALRIYHQRPPSCITEGENWYRLIFRIQLCSFLSIHLIHAFNAVYFMSFRYKHLLSKILRDTLISGSRKLYEKPCMCLQALCSQKWSNLSGRVLEIKIYHIQHNLIWSFYTSLKIFKDFSCS